LPVPASLIVMLPLLPAIIRAARRERMLRVVTLLATLIVGPVVAGRHSVGVGRAGRSLMLGIMAGRRLVRVIRRCAMMLAIDLVSIRSAGRGFVLLVVAVAPPLAIPVLVVTVAGPAVVRTA
jgi:hypothetical protein